MASIAEFHCGLVKNKLLSKPVSLVAGFAVLILGGFMLKGSARERSLFLFVTVKAFLCGHCLPEGKERRCDREAAYDDEFSVQIVSQGQPYFRDALSDFFSGT